MCVRCAGSSCRALAHSCSSAKEGKTKLWPGVPQAGKIFKAGGDRLLSRALQEKCRLLSPTREQLHITEPNREQFRQSSKHSGEVRSALCPAAARKAGEEICSGWEHSLSWAGGRNVLPMDKVALPRWSDSVAPFFPEQALWVPLVAKIAPLLTSSFTNGQESIHSHGAILLGLVGHPQLALSSKVKFRGEKNT